MRWKLDCNLFLGCAAVAVLSTASTGNSSMPKMEVSPTLQVTLAPKQAGSIPAPLILLGRTLPQVTVVLKNVGSSPLRLWKDTCSWGYQNLSFEITDGDGRR